MALKRLIALLLALVMTLTLATAALADEKIKRGDRNDDEGIEGLVDEAQAALASLGYYTGELDGYFGKGMENAVKKFQRRNKLGADGVIGTKTWAALRSGDAVAATDPSFVILKQGSTGDSVRELQEALEQYYYYNGDVDGTFGASTKEAVIAFQASAGYTRDGKVGETTWSALMNRSARVLNGGYPVRTLKGGSRGYDVYTLQLRLVELNYLSSIPNNGYYGDTTAAAVKKFQKANGLTQNGNVTSNVVRYLWPGDVVPDGDTDTGDRVLKKGDNGKDVATVQMHLKAGGYLLGKADGVFGTQTVAAVKLLQKYYKIKQDGKVGKETLALILAIPLTDAEPETDGDDEPAEGSVTKPLRQGDKGVNVRRMQEKLIIDGWLSDGDDDGVFGPRTYRAVRNFQKRYGLKVDGIAGKDTLSLLSYRTQ